MRKNTEPKPEAKQGVVALNEFPGQSGQQTEKSALGSVETKQAVVTSADVKSGKRLRVAGLRGGFGRTHFNDDCVTSKPVDDETEAQLRSSFGDAVEVVE